jgi:hypothetical protein
MKLILLLLLFQFQVEFWNKIDVNDDPDPEVMNNHIQFMKNELTQEDINWDSIKSVWKKTLVERRSYVQNHTIKEILEEYPGYTQAFLVGESLLFC